MIPVWLALLGLGVAGWVAGGLAGEPVDRRRIALGAAAGAVATFLVGLWAGLDPVRAGGLALVTGVAAAAWDLIRSARPLPAVRAGLALAVLAAAVGLVALLEEVWMVGAAAPAAPPLPAIGAIAFLTAAGNGVVRTVLAAAGTDFERSQQTLRGGRVIGVVERYLIFALAIAGQLTAAVVVATAKGILRFPELQAAREQTLEVVGEGRRRVEAPSSVDLITEYFLIGSLTSWLLAVVLGLVAGI